MTSTIGTSATPVQTGPSQIITIHGPGGRPVPISLETLSNAYSGAASLCILYSVQAGACIMMLVIVLSMTARKRLKRLTTLINIALLVLNAVRMIFLATFFTSSFAGIYVNFTRDTRTVPRKDFNFSVATTTLSIPITILIEAALILQAWAMLQLWRSVWKIGAMAISAALVIATVGFCVGSAVIQARSILQIAPLPTVNRIRQAYLGLTTASICWFCFVFNIRLIMHMWSNRSILPSIKGLKPMDVLVITNGILMFIPVVFSGLEWANLPNFEAGSLTYTSVILVLPLGTLIAQRIAKPMWFGAVTVDAENAQRYPSGGGRGKGAHNLPNISINSETTAVSGSGTTTTSGSRKPLLKRVLGEGKRDRGHSDAQEVQHGDVGQGHVGGGRGGVVQTHTASDSLALGQQQPHLQEHEKYQREEYAVERELARIDAGDLESGYGPGYGKGGGHPHGGVKVDYGILRRSEERVGS